MQEKTNLIKITEAYHSYKSIKNMREQSRIDQFLINQLDDEIIYMFNRVGQGQSSLNQFVPNFLDQFLHDYAKSIIQSRLDEKYDDLNNYIQKPKSLFICLVNFQQFVYITQSTLVLNNIEYLLVELLNRSK
ncbi:hypothetical protein pb186bvf_018275 [Paramecium bursaria]